MPNSSSPPPASTAHSPSAAGDTRSLLRALDRQAAIGLELRSLSQRQRDLLETGRAGEVLEVVTDRQALVDELIALDRQCQPFFSDWPRTLDSLGADDRKRAEQLRASLTQNITQVLADDEVDRAMMEREQQAIDRQLRNLARGRTTNRAYVDSHAQCAAMPDNRYTDRRG